MKLLVVAKDLGGGAVVAPLCRLALDRGDEVVAVVEGLAPVEFTKLGVPIYFQGTPNFSEFPFSLDAGKLINHVKPDAVVISLGSPINLENQFGLAANKAHRPLVFLEDCHGAHVRTGAKPELILTVDAHAADLATKAHQTAQVAVVGHPGVPSAGEVLGIRDNFLSDIKHSGKRVYAYVGGDPGATEEQLKLLVNCLAMTRGDWCLVYRFHPKWVGVVNPDSGRTYGKEWEEILSTLGDKTLRDLTGSGRCLVASADVALADFSTLLTTAVCCGKTAVFLETPAVIQSMKIATGLVHFPLVEMGLAHRVSDPVDLGLLKLPSVDNLAMLRPYDPAVAYEQIRCLVR